jgi:hypothetical protein
MTNTTRQSLVVFVVIDIVIGVFIRIISNIGAIGTAAVGHHIQLIVFNRGLRILSVVLLGLDTG